MTRSIIIEITGNDPKALDAYAEILADLADDAMVSQESENQIPKGIKYEGVAVIDPDAPEAEELTPVTELPPQN